MSGDTSNTDEFSSTLFLYPNMKQKKIVINGNYTLEGEKLIGEYFETKNKNGIEGFVSSIEEFNARHKNTYALIELSNPDYHAIYSVDKCDICFKSYDAIIVNRNHLYQHLNATYRLCNTCKNLHENMISNLSIQLDGDIAI